LHFFGADDSHEATRCRAAPEEPGIMYEEHFGLRHRPFRTTPDSGSYYPATGHEVVLAQLLQAISQDEGLVCVTGCPGTGKTLLCHRLLERLGADVTSAFLTNSHFRDRSALLQAILYDLTQPYEEQSEQELRLTLTDFLLKNYGAGKRAVLIVDEAQHLSGDLLEELRLLGNLEASDGKAMQTVLVAQPEFLEKLERPDLAVLRQRLALRLELVPFTTEEAGDYVLNQIRCAGARPEAVIGEEALGILAGAAHGIPRLLNQLGNQSLTLACQNGSSEVDAEAILEALATLGWQAPEDETETEAQMPTANDSTPDTEAAEEPLFVLEPEGESATETGATRHEGPHRLFASPRRA
jgi:type II secretory pathway predicted ATPase ExeA